MNITGKLSAQFALRTSIQGREKESIADEFIRRPYRNNGLHLKRFLSSIEKLNNDHLFLSSATEVAER